jgi:hypothetical protein
VNGDSDDHSASEDVAVSGGSDTDISRPGSVDQTKERHEGHLRSNSMKKPVSFKSVSVTKSFLAKSVTPTPSARPGEKVAAPGQTNAMLQQTAKPRLVAKSGTGLGNMPRSSLAMTNGAGSGPDATKVWNKNQPVPIPPPKQFTDEELKQQYGIHLATRLQADEGGSKEAKWADIDDDEDDWAPDTVQWMDGTKSTVAAVENQPPPPEEPKPVEMLETVVEAPRPAPTSVVVAQRPTSTSGTKTILKPGAHAQSGSTKTGLVLKGQPEKPTLVAKPSAATVKSPWAPLPPVEKVSPLVVNPPTQQAPPSRFSQRDSHGYDTMPPPPAKEIAPDDFNRSWRDERGNRDGNRELFNSHSGRYEPVNEMRRGSVRENNFRQQPSVLQRPSHDSTEPAGPSAAFQTSRNSGDAPGTWGRRRNSSNVSGGSGRRMSIDRRGPEMLHMSTTMQRRGSQSVNGIDPATPGTPRPAFAQKATLGDSHSSVFEEGPFVQRPSPNVSNAQLASPLGSVASSALPDGPAVAPSVPVQQENPVEIQNRLMREKLERARLAKQKQREAEDKEEAEKKERLRKKLESLGLSDSPKTKAKEPALSITAEKSPQKEKAVPAPIQSPPKPPVPTSEGEIAQYGMMKVHQPHPVKKPYLSDHTATKSFRGADSAPQPSSSPVKAQYSAPSPSQPQPQTPASTRENEKNGQQIEQSQEQQPEGPALQGLKSAQPTKTAWTPSLPQIPQIPQQSARPWVSNVWGPPQTKDRALGNGTFDSGYTRGQPRTGSQQLPSQPQPVQAPTAATKTSPAPPQVAPTQPFVQQPMYTQAGAVPAQQTKNAPNPGAIAPPPAKTWGNFAAAIRHDDQSSAVKSRQELERLGGQTFRPEIHETFIDQKGNPQKTLHSKVGGHNAPLTDNGIRPKISPPTTSSELNSKDEVIKPVIDGLAVQSTIGQNAHLQSATQLARPSRFFPRPSETAPFSSTSNVADSPPPPETESHPAFDSDSAHPVVKMPKPSPRVRLPPAAIAEASTPAEAPVSMPSRARLGLGARPLALDPEWQARFNGLLRSPTATPAQLAKGPSAAGSKPGSFAIAASSKAPLDVRENVASATVSLPNAIAKKTFAEDGSSEVITRVIAEGILLEDREFGSLPTVKLSKVPHLAANEPPAGFPSNRSSPRYQRPLEITSKSPFNVDDIDHSASAIDIIVRTEHMRVAVTKSMVKKYGSRKSLVYNNSNNNNNNNNNNNKPKRNNAPNGGPSGPGSGPNLGVGPNQRPRKPSNYQSQGPNTNPPRTSGGNGWTTTNRSTPPHNNNNTNTTTNSPWTRRATPAAPVH